MFCPNCGQKSEGLFCPNCGVMLPTERTVGENVKTSKPKRKRLLFLIILGTILTVICVGLVLSGFSQKCAEHTACKAITAWIENDRETLSEYVYPAMRILMLYYVDGESSTNVVTDVEVLSASKESKKELKDELAKLEYYYDEEIPGTELWHVRVYITWQRSGYDGNSSTEHWASVMCIRGKWYIVDMQ